MSIVIDWPLLRAAGFCDSYSRHSNDSILSSTATGCPIFSISLPMFVVVIVMCIYYYFLFKWSVLNPAPAIRLLISGDAASCLRNSVLFSDSAFSTGFGRAARLDLTTSTICLTADVVIAPAFATLPTTSATFFILSLFALMKLLTDASVLGIQSRKPPPTTRRRRLLPANTKMFLYLAYMKSYSYILIMKV